jgi:hypothetical protein
LYHLLNSYHMGTNRAIFFLQPRPHTAQQKDRFTFINGPQQIEGIQEFFLVVNRPKGTKIDVDYCVDALLYAAYLDDDAAASLLAEPKTRETGWTDIWITKEQLPKPDDNGGLLDSILGTLSAGFLTIPGVNDPVTDTVNAISSAPSLPDDLDKWFAGVTGGSQVKIVRAGIADLTIPPLARPSGHVVVGPPGSPLQKPSMAGWRVDRTRGLGGYDLWENPNNFSGSPFGQDPDKAAPKTPHTFVDILSIGDPDDPLNYYPDYGIRFRAYAWPTQNHHALYHAQVKVYLIRDDRPTDQRQVPMFVLARGTSTCSDSPVYSLFTDDLGKVGPNSRAELLTELRIHPPSVAPWRADQPVAAASAPAAAVPAPAPQAQQGPPAAPEPSPMTMRSAPLSGQDPTAIGTARAKMANEMGALVRHQLQASIAGLECTGHEALYRFRESDFFFQRVGRAIMLGEIQHLTSVTRAAPGLASFVALHPNLAAIDVLAQLTPQVKERAGGAKSTIRRSKAHPVLTLGGERLSSDDRETLRRGGVLSGLDMIGVSAAHLAARLDVDESTARQLRLRVLGLA